MRVLLPIFQNRPRSKDASSVVARATLAEMALDLALLAEIVADHAPHSSLPTLEKAVHALRAGVLLIGQTFREAEAAEGREERS